MHNNTTAARMLLTACASLIALTACYRRADLYPEVQPEAEMAKVSHGPSPESGVVADATAAPAEIAVVAYRELPGGSALPAVPREFRGVWVATVHNMDWPSRRSLSTHAAQQELLRILDTARDMGLNAVILQVRPAADALYSSAIEPWSDYLTGESGRAPEPYWDPLEFAVAEAHARGLELHAWFNPFRAWFATKRAQPSASHVMRRRPDLVRRYGTHFWLDPAEPDARAQALDVISDVVRRYDIDAVHIDDYFYPYQERDARGRLIQFPDDATWQRYGARSGMSRADWRRHNIDTFIEQLHGTVRAVKPDVRVGISPFGIWRTGHPPTVRGLDAYTELFADSRKWLQNGWADYYAPQLYWRTFAPEQDYATLLKWWSDQNRHGRHIWAGNIPNNINPDAARGWRTTEIIDQVRLTRENAGITGNIHFSATSLLRDRDGLGQTFRSQLYQEPALVPASPWLSPGRLLKPGLDIEENAALRVTSVRVSFDGAPGRWIVHSRHADAWRTQLLPGPTRRMQISWWQDTPPEVIAVSAVDRAGVEGESAIYIRDNARAGLATRAPRSGSD
jgi:uncharacterized lipoprotein YddW (UPF0748 family)